MHIVEKKEERYSIVNSKGEYWTGRTCYVGGTARWGTWKQRWDTNFRKWAEEELEYLEKKERKENEHIHKSS
jgi:hypothetical protein